MVTHVQITAIMHIIYGAMGLLGGIFALFIFGGIGAFIGFSEPDAFFMLPLMMVIGGVILMITLACSLPGIIAGVGLLRYAPWARIVAIIVSIIYIPLHIPFGTILGAYTLWVLLTPEGAQLFEVRQSPNPTPQSNQHQ